MERRLLQIIAVLASGLTLVGCTPRPQVLVLISMMADQEAYFKNELVPAFEKKYPSVIEVIHYGSTDSIEDIMRQRAGTISLVKVPFDKAGPLMRKGMFAPLSSVLAGDGLKKFKDAYLLTSLGAMDGKQYLVPRKFETRIMVYCKSKVADAAASWRTWKDSIDAVLKHYNGYGLPSTYLLEDDPEQWDYFDIFVAGWIWGHTLYNGKVQSRIGHRGKRYSGTTLRVIDRIFQLGGDSSAVLSMKGDAVVDAICWEAIYTAAGIYNEKMWSERWSGSDIWQRFASGDVFLSFMTQLDCFFLHGTGSDNLDGFFQLPEDMGVATMPRACSVQLDAAGIPHNGSKAVTTGGWWWAIPADAPSPALGFELASFISGTSAQIQECSRFGMIPVRKDILSDMSMMFGGGWIKNIYEMSFKQLVKNGYTVLPGSSNFNEVGRLYLDLIDEVIVNRHWAAEGAFPQREYIREVITSLYQPKIVQTLQTVP
ncbi:MAG: ABC transporter substrate-binding protein [Chitinispirillaceae bacterium]|nr:ABC transporter substrate-binding protein [Chitinispirillaceae bacterium]